MSEVFEGYERQYCELSANLLRQCTAASALVGELKKLKLSEIKAGLDDADALIMKMDLEARSLQPSIKATLLAKLREYKTDLNNLKNEVKRITSANVSLTARDELLESGRADTLVVLNDQKGRLLMSTERLNQSTDRIKESRRTMLETEELGVSILQDLHQQRQSLLHAHKTDLATGSTIGVAEEQGGLYYLSDERDGQKVLSSCLQSHSESHSPTSQVWLQHKRLGHPPFSLIKSMFPSLFLQQFVESFKCDVCQFAKHHRVTFPSSFNKSVEPFDLIHSDVWGLAPISNISGARWFVSFIDNCTQVTWLFLMKDKSEVPLLFTQFYHMVQTQFGKCIKRLHLDNGKEYVNHSLSSFNSKQGIIHEFTCVDTPQQNEVAERKNRHLLEVARALLFQMSVPKSYWGEAVLTVAYLISRIPSPVLGNVSPV